ncbi:hypothetical protein ABZ733_36125 [Streptomyces longwoodensis]|uniref:hypothetical protein n=1 Tax=Streptomyces longwoodensis TaxID=68231 RepID=UPI0034023014
MHRTTARASGWYLSVQAVGWSAVALLQLLAGSSLANRVAGELTIGILLLVLLGLSVPLSSWWFYRATRQSSLPRGGAATSPARSGR